MTKMWREVRAKAIADGQVTEEGISRARAKQEAGVRAWRLAEVRKSQRRTQIEMSHALNISQSRVSRLEHGELEHTEVGTLVSYVEALGGRLRVVADFGDQTLVLS